MGRSIEKTATGAGVTVAPFPEGQLPEGCRERWAQLWEDGARFYTSSSIQAAVELVRAEVLSGMLWSKISAEGGHLSEGMNGQPVISPDFKAWTQVQAHLTKLQDRFGANPRACAEVGLTNMELAKLDAGDSLDELKALDI